MIKPEEILVKGYLSQVSKVWPLVGHYAEYSGLLQGVGHM